MFFDPPPLRLPPKLSLQDRDLFYSRDCKNPGNLIEYPSVICGKGASATGMDPAVKKETGYAAVWVAVLSLLMEAVFLILRKWDLSVLLGNLGGGAVAIGNYWLLGRTVSRAIAQGKPEEAARRVRASAGLRLLGSALVCVLLITLGKTSVYATVIPLLFPRIGLMFRPMIDRKRGVSSAGEEGSDLID